MSPDPKELQEAEDLLIMPEREWPVYAVLLKTGELYYHEPALGNRHGTGSGWLMVLPWGEKLKPGGIAHGDNRFGIKPEDVSDFVLINPFQSLREAEAERDELRGKYAKSQEDCARKDEALAVVRDGYCVSTNGNIHEHPRVSKEHELCVVCRKVLAALSHGPDWLKRHDAEKDAEWNKWVLEILALDPWTREELDKASNRPELAELHRKNIEKKDTRIRELEERLKKAEGGGK